MKARILSVVVLSMDSSFYSAEIVIFFSANEDQPMYISGDWDNANINLLVYSVFFRVILLQRTKWDTYNISFYLFYLPSK